MINFYKMLHASRGQSSCICMGSTKIKAQGQSQGHVISALCFSLKS